MSTSNKNNNGAERPAKRKPTNKQPKKSKGPTPPRGEGRSSSSNGTSAKSPLTDSKSANATSLSPAESNTYSGSSFHSSPATSTLPRPSFANGSPVGSPPHRPVAFPVQVPSLAPGPMRDPASNVQLGCQPYPPPYIGQHQQYFAPAPAPIYPPYAYAPPMGMHFMPPPQASMAAYGQPPVAPQSTPRARST